MRNKKNKVALTVVIFASLFLEACGLVRLRSHDHIDTEPTYHQVQSGETLYSISRRYNVGVQSIAMLNGIRDTSRLSVGRTLLIAYGAESAGEVRTAVSANDKAHLHHASYSGKSEAPAESYSSGKLYWPVASGRIVSRFGPRSRSFHDGLDIAARSGTPVLAAHDGQVVYSGRGLGGYGNLIILREQSGMLTIYAHNSRLLAQRGARVKRGQQIALVGSTGRSSGPHLHFEVRSKDRRGRYIAVDPMAYFQKTDKPPRYRVNESLTPILASLGFSR